MITPNKSFEISALSEEDLQYLGFDTSGLDDSTMERIASKMGDNYCDQLYWDSLQVIAECMGIPKVES